MGLVAAQRTRVGERVLCRRHGPDGRRSSEGRESAKVSAWLSSGKHNPGGCDMARYVLQRLASLLFIVFAITVFCFLLVHLLPGDPTAIILGTADNAHTGAILDAQLGLNKPILEQYFIWLGNVLHGNLGISQTSGASVNSIIRQSLKIDVELIIYSQLIAFAVAIPLAVYAARRSGGVLDQSSTSVTFAFYCLPSFVLILWLVQLLCFHWPHLPGPGSDPFQTGSPWFAEIGNR